MARLIPQRSTCLTQMTQGEKRFSERLEQKLEDDYLVWYRVPIGPRQQRPDFIVLHPRRGLLVLEVKDWTSESIVQADRRQLALSTARGLIREPNPLLQAHAHAQEIKAILEADPALRQPTDSRDAGQLIMPWGYGVILPRIGRQQFVEGGLEAAMAGHRVICQDEMPETVEPEAFQQRLWAMFGHSFPVALSYPQIERIRWHLFPELRLTSAAGQFGLFGDETTTEAGPLQIPELIRVMDQQQESLARSLGDGHRVIHGVAGSGKTMILGYRAMHLARSQNRPILVLCYNPALAARLLHVVRQRGLEDRISVFDFHRWCQEMLVTYHVPVPRRDGADDRQAWPEAVIAAVERGQIPRAQYGAVLVDEGQDFEPDWYRLIVQMVDPASKSLLVFYDDAQPGQDSPARPAFSWKSVGIEAAGHTTILKLNYRNTLEILAVARDFAQTLLQGAAEPGADSRVSTDSAGRHGPLPELLRTADAADEARQLLQMIRREQAAGRPLSAIAVLTRSTADSRDWQGRLEAAGISARVAHETGGSSLYLEGATVKLVTMQASKGLEFPVVLIPGLGTMPGPGEDETEEARRLYIAMTRASERLIMLHDRDSIFSRRIRQAINQVQEQLGSGGG